MSDRLKILDVKYKTYQYHTSSSYFIRKTIITMKLTILMKNGNKHYDWTRARTSTVVRDRRHNDQVAWKFSHNNLLNIKCGDNLEYEQ